MILILKLLIQVKLRIGNKRIGIVKSKENDWNEQRGGKRRSLELSDVTKGRRRGFDDVTAQQQQREVPGQRETWRPLRATTKHPICINCWLFDKAASNWWWKSVLTWLPVANGLLPSYRHPFSAHFRALTATENLIFIYLLDGSLCAFFFSLSIT